MRKTWSVLFSPGLPRVALAARGRDRPSASWATRLIPRPKSRASTVVIDEINAQALDFVVHVGDIGSSSLACGDAWLLERKAQFARIRHRFILLPGDNEWRTARPLARLRRWREIFCETPREFCEHRRWEANGWVFVALNVPGHDNNVRHAEHGAAHGGGASFLDEARRGRLRKEERADGVHAGESVLHPAARRLRVAAGNA